jgi:hypothetical protein
VLSSVPQDDLATKRGASSGLNPGWEASKPFIDRDNPGCRITSVKEGSEPERNLEEHKKGRKVVEPEDEDE